MAFCANGIRTYLVNHDVAGCIGATLFSDRTNLLVIPQERILTEDTLTLKVHQYAAEGHGVMNYAAGDSTVPSDVFLQEQTVEWNLCAAPPVLHQFCWLKHVREVDLHTNFVFDSTSSALLLSHDMPTHRPIHVLELYAGGHGGWQHGMSFIESHVEAVQVDTVAVEQDLRLCAEYAITHQAQLFSDDQGIRADQLSTHKHTIICADVRSTGWHRAIHDWQVDLATVSSPCPPWSRAANSLGLDCDDGRLLVHSIIDCRFFRPHAILIEQVPGFTAHHHRHLVEKALHWIGYVIVWQSVVNVDQMLKTNRPRWLAMAVRVHGAFSPHIGLGSFQGVSQPGDFSPLCPLTEHQLQSMHLSDDVVVIASHERFVFGSFSSADRTRIMESRVYDPNDVTPTFMAKYGAQHKLPSDFLAKHKYLGHFVRDDSAPYQCRFWHPHEVLLKHGVTATTFMSDDDEHNWHKLGNQITQAQAMVALIQGFSQLIPDVIDSEALFVDYQAGRLSASNVTVHAITGGSLIAPTTLSITDAFVAHCEHLLIACSDPDFGYIHWCPQQGMQMPTLQLPDGNPVVLPSALTPIDVTDSETDVPGTMPFSVFMKGALISGTGVSTFWFASNLPLDHLSEPWEGFGIAALTNHATVGQPQVELTLVDVPRHADLATACVICTIQDEHLTLLSASPGELLINHEVIASTTDTPYDQFGPLSQMQAADPMNIVLSA